MEGDGRKMMVQNKRVVIMFLTMLIFSVQISCCHGRTICSLQHSVRMTMAAGEAHTLRKQGGDRYTPAPPIYNRKRSQMILVPPPPPATA